jgi:hypothetical protein
MKSEIFLAAYEFILMVIDSYNKEGSQKGGAFSSPKCVLRAITAVAAA